MNKINVSIRFADGGAQEFTKDQEFLHELRSLQSQNVSGKQLIHRLISDDWAAPPILVEIYGQDSDGKPFETRIPYA